jgi:hypothetical protein
MAIRSGTLRNVRWVLEKSARSAVREGKHLILHFEEGKPYPSAAQRRTLLALASRLADELASKIGEEGRWRIGVNGPGVSTRPTFHIHLIFPVGDDILPRFVDQYGGSEV